MNNMRTYFYFLFFLAAALFHIDARAQCQEEQLITSAKTYGLECQEITAYCSGTLEQVQFRTDIFTNSNPSIFRLKTLSPCSDRWTVTGFPVAPSSTITINLADGSGSSRALVAGQKYLICLGTTVQFEWHELKLSGLNANPYAGGRARTVNCGTGSDVDLWFRYSINGPLLPVELTDFTVQPSPDGPSVAIAWHTASEQNTSHFAIQHSADGLVFKDIGEIPAQGTTTEPQTYHFTHRRPAFGDNYYRLHIVDLDGSFEYSKVVHISMENEEKSLLISPNPAPGAFTVMWPRLPKQGGELVLRHLTGQTVFRMAVPAGQQQIEIHPPGLDAGIYLLEWHEGSVRVSCERVVLGRS